MRLSPVLVACLAATATLGVSNSAQAETTRPDSSRPKSGATVAVVPSPVTLAPVELQQPQISATPRWVVPVAPPEAIAQAQTPPPDPIAPPGTQSTPQQETPDQIRIGPPSTIQLTPAPVAPGTETPTTPAPTTPAPTTTPPTVPGPATPPQADSEPKVLVGEVDVKGVDGPLQAEVYRVIRTQPGRTTTRTLLQEDINAIFGTGFFSNVRATPEDTPLGVRVTFEVQANPILGSVRLEGTKVLPQSIADAAFSPQYGSILNLVRLQEGIKIVNKWYQDNGYVLAQIVGSPQVSPDGTVVLEVAEGVIENIQVRFINKEGSEIVIDKAGNPVTDKDGNQVRIKGKTRPFIITREFELKPGTVFNRNIAERDLQRVYGLGVFEDVKLSLNPGQDPKQVVVVANVTEKNTGSVAAGAGISSASGLFGTLSYQQQNLGGNNQKFGGELQIGQRETLFDLNFTDPWIANDPFRTSYTVSLFKRRTISLIFDGGDDEVRLPNGDRPRIDRTGGGISFSRPLSKEVFRRSEWVASLGAQYQRVAIRDSNGKFRFRDELGNLLSFDDSGKDDLFTLQFGAVRDRRDDPLRPIKGSLLRFGTEQSIPLGRGNILLNRLRASYSFYLPSKLLKLTPGCRKVNASTTDCPQTLAINIQGGTVIGDLPPYEAFSLGGSNSIRGYDEGDVGGSRSFLQGTIEYRFPIFSVISGALFIDGGTSLGSQSSVPGNPGRVRGKPENGLGYGLGLRVQSPLGPIRIDYGFNDNGKGRLHFGIGERF
jgi:outer membrane protein insertion porin family